MKLLALGDSYTIGEGVSKTDSWPVQLCRMVRALGDSDPLIIAKTGWTTVDLLQAIAGEDLSTTYALVSLLVGVNDQYDGLGLDTFRSGLATLLLKSIELAKQDPSHVIVLSIPDYSITPLVEGMDQARIREELEAFNQHKQTMASRAGVHYIDITDLSRRAEWDPTLLAEDGLHPSGKMYTLWAARLAPIVEQILIS
jgi:lysophospholipase L1-like esterase